MRYFVVDPFRSNVAGGSTYVNSFKSIKLDIDLVVITLNKQSPFFQAKELMWKLKQHNFSPNDIIEVPDSRYLSLFLSADNCHVRLHCPFEIACKYDKKKNPFVRTILEKKGVSKARFVSSPSKTMLSELYEYNLKCSYIYPHPIIMNTTAVCSTTAKSYDVAFIGRLQEIKGFKTFLRIAKLRPKLKFLIISPHIQGQFGNITAVRAVGEKKYKYISLAQIAVVPSAFESFSYTASEAIVCGVPVVVFKCVGIKEYFSEPMLYICEGESFEDVLYTLDFALDRTRSHPLELGVVHEAVNKVNSEFKNGVMEVVSDYNEQ